LTNRAIESVRLAKPWSTPRHEEELFQARDDLLSVDGEDELTENVEGIVPSRVRVSPGRAVSWIVMTAS
jgi:hypothetical protein